MKNGFQVRRPGREDIGALVALVRECQIADFGALPMTEADLAHAWGLLDLDKDAWLAEDHDGRPVAYAGVRASLPNMFAFAGVLPEQRGRGIGTRLVTLTEGRARQALDDAPEDARVTLAQPLAPANEGARELLERHGYERVRFFWEMEIELDREPPQPNLPSGIRLDTLVSGNDRAVYEAMQEAFQDHWNFTPRPYDEWRSWNIEGPSFDPDLWLLAFDGDEIAGASLCAARPDAGWVNILGVRSRWRRRGLGQALLQESFRTLHRRGFRKVGLDVDAANPTGATRLYERAGMHVARESESYQKVLREGAGSSG